MPSMTTREERLTWFREAKFGMFVHWGCYSVLGRGEQVMARDLIPPAEYDLLAGQFRPDADWAEKLAQAAVQAGARYIVLTTRHHDGYCLFDTATHDFNAAKTGPGRDLVAEYAAAARAAGLKVGFYYSLLNWRWRCHWSPEAHKNDLPNMVDEVHAQVRELMANYGAVDLLWYDGASLPGSACHGMWGGKALEQTPAEFWRSQELNAMARELQPEILINNRSGLLEDFGTPEQRVVAEEARPWEACMTLNYAPGWGYLKHSLANKTSGEVLFNLVDAVRLGGNFLFNVGPKPDGLIDGRETRVLEEVGRWMDVHGEAIYGTKPGGLYDLSRGRVQGPMFQYGMWTCKGSTAYFTILYYPGSELIVSKVQPGIKSATLLTTGQRLEVVPMANSRTCLRGLPAAPPDNLPPVIKVEFEGPPCAVTTLSAEWLDGTFS